MSINSATTSSLDTPHLLTSVDCWVLFYRSQISCPSNHLQWLVQVDCCNGFWGSNICSIYFSKRFLLIWIESWGSMWSSNLFSNLQVDCNLLQNIPSLPQRLFHILWERMGPKAATRWTHRSCWSQPHWSLWPHNTNWFCWPHWSCQLHWSQHSNWPGGLHWLQLPYRPHWP